MFDTQDKILVILAWTIFQFYVMWKFLKAQKNEIREVEEGDIKPKLAVHSFKKHNYQYVRKSGHRKASTSSLVRS
jgi:hypothetical protein